MLRKSSSVLDFVLSVLLLSSCTSDLHAGMTCLNKLLSFVLLSDGVGVCGVVFGDVGLLARYFIHVGGDVCCCVVSVCCGVVFVVVGVTVCLFVVVVGWFIFGVVVVCVAVCLFVFVLSVVVCRILAYDRVV